MRRSRHILLVVTLILPLGFTMAGEEKDAPSQPESVPAAGEAAEADRPDGDEEALRFTNEDLKPVRPQDRYEDRDEGMTGEDDAGEAGESLDAAMESISEEALKATMDETRREIAELEFHLEYLTKRLLSVQNPLLKRVTPSTREEEIAVGGLSNGDRLAWVKDQIVLTEDDLAEAQEYMSTLMRR